MELAREQIRQEQEQQQQREARERADAERATLEEELRGLRKDPSLTARRALDQIAEDTNIVIPVALREQFETWAQNLVDKSEQLATLSLGDQARQAAAEEQQSFKDACYAAVGPANRAAFVKEVDGQDHEFWVQTAAKYAAQASGALTPTSLVEDAKAYAAEAASTLDATEQKALADALAGKTKGKDILTTVAHFMLEKGKRGPGAAPAASGERQNAGGFARLRDYENAYIARSITRDEYDEAKARNSRGLLPA